MAGIHPLVFIIVGGVITFMSRNLGPEFTLFFYAGIGFLGFGFFKLFLMVLLNASKKKEQPATTPQQKQHHGHHQQKQHATHHHTHHRRHCAQCGVQVGTHDRFCRGCGARL